MSGSSPSALPGALDATTFDAFPVPVWVTGPNTNAVNAAFRALTGLGESPTFDEFAALIHPADRERVEAQAQEALESAERRRREFRLRTVDGSYRWVLAESRPAAEPARRIGTIIDVDAERRARDRLDLLGDVASVQVAAGDVVGAMSAVLDALVPRHADVAGIDLIDDLGTGVEQINAGTPERRAAVAALSRHYRSIDDEFTPIGVARLGRPLFLPAGTRRVDTEEPEAQVLHRAIDARSGVSVPLFVGGRSIGALTLARCGADAELYQSADLPLFTDVATRVGEMLARVAIERDLRASEERYRTLAEALPQLVAITTVEGTVAYLNDRWWDYTGIPRDADLTLAWQRVVHPEDLAQLVPAWQEAVRAGTIFETEYRLRRHDGVFRWFLNRAVPLRERGGSITSWVATATDIDDRVRNEARLRLVAEATSLLASTLDSSETVERLADIVARDFADWCSVSVFDDDGRLRPVAIGHADPSMLTYAREMSRRYPTRDNDPILDVLRDGEPVLYETIPPEALKAAAQDEEHYEMLRRLGMESVIVVPLGTPAEWFGMLVLISTRPGKRYDASDLQVAAMLGRRASIAIANARLYAKRDRAARVLQRAFLPSTLPSDEHVALSALSVPAASAEVGGDWYDAVRRDDGVLMLTVGDVAGRGLEAAIPMGKLRQALRALMLVEGSPARLLLLADTVLRREHPDIFATCAVVALDPSDGTLRYASAGHPNPLIRHPDGTIEPLIAGGLPLGLHDVVAYQDSAAKLPLGGLLVLHSDGLIESTHDVIAGEAALARALEDEALDVASDVAAVLHALVLGGGARDDVTILAARRGRGPTWTFDGRDGVAAQAARAAFAAELAREGVSAEAGLPAEVVFGELIGNVARYAPGPVDVRLSRMNDELVLHVLDRGPAFVWRETLPEDFSENGRGLFLIETLACSRTARHIDHYGNLVRVTFENG